MRSSSLISYFIVFALIALPAQSVAWSKRAEWMFKPHIGVQYQYLSTDFTEDRFTSNAFIDYDRLYEDAYHGYNIHFGARIHNRIGIEVSYFTTSEETRDIPRGTPSTGLIGPAATIDSEFSGWNYDLMYFYRFKQRWEWILSLGIGDWDLDTSFRPTSSSDGLGVSQYRNDASDTFGRYGLGLQYRVSKRLYIRGIMHYLDIDMEDTMDGAWTGSLGAHIAF